MYKLCYFVPPSHLDVTKSVLFDIGAGKLGHYDRCCWQVLGEGQFRPLQHSKPSVGVEGKLEQLAEYRVEMVCEDNLVGAAVMQLKTAHPYEHPAIDVWRLEEFSFVE